MVAERLPRLRAVRRGALVVEPTRFLNLGQISATACAGDATSGRGPDLLRQGLPAGPDLVITAFGTNDVQQGAGGVAVGCHRVLEEMAAPAPVLIGLVPPIFMPATDWNPGVDAINRQLRDAFPPNRVVDLWTGFGRQHYEGPVHLNAAGQALRAERVVAALRTFTAGCVP
jgi:lysophospholipase L1-like esterase